MEQFFVPKGQKMKKNDEESELCSSSSSSTDLSSICPICLSHTLHESFLDKCFHKFCFDCILRWTKVVSRNNSHKLASLKCPLCKEESFSIVHGFDGNSFQRHYINQDLENGFVFTKAHKYRLQCYYSKPGLLSDIFNVSHYWKSHKYLQPNRWLQTWLRREIQTLMQEEDVDIILHHIHGIIVSALTSKKLEEKPPEAKRVEFQSLICDAARCFLGARTELFVSELETFLASGLNIEAYDAVYKQRLDLSETTGESGNNETLGQVSGNRVGIPYLFIFDEDSDGTD